MVKCWCEKYFLRLQFWQNRKKILAETDQGFFPLLFPAAIGRITFYKLKRRKFFKNALPEKRTRHYMRPGKTKTYIFCKFQSEVEQNISASFPGDFQLQLVAKDFYEIFHKILE